MKLEFDGVSILSESDFHEALTEALGLSTFYGKNLDALWDLLSRDVERPVLLEWKNAEISKAAMGDRFDSIVGILRDVEKQDIEYGWTERFELALA
ncbi:barstar family protein [Massilia sp. TWP1-3-3]|uniref:barstar family protein n=1 Tax=Massilia sp. TWP1-3-3 TaxID=2804573 RepID=UPI003CEF3762